MLVPPAGSQRATQRLTGSQAGPEQPAPQQRDGRRRQQQSDVARNGHRGAADEGAALAAHPGADQGREQAAEGDPGDEGGLPGARPLHSDARIARMQQAAAVLDHMLGCTSDRPLDCSMTGAYLESRVAAALDGVETVAEFYPEGVRGIG